MKLYQENNKVIIDKIKDFEPKHIFECGQCFRWDKEEDGSYTGVANGKILNVKNYLRVIKKHILGLLRKNSMIIFLCEKRK